MRSLPKEFSHPTGGLMVLLLASAPAVAQQPMALPGITIEGATLERGAMAPRPAGTPAQVGQLAMPEVAAIDGTVLGVAAETVGNAVTVLTGEDLRRQQIRNAADALRSLPGVAVNRQGGAGNLTQVRIRGAEANHTLVLIDGIVANNTADGEFDFSNLSAEEIERIEIIRGPMSSLYGSNAVGGVVNIISRRGQGPLTATLQTEAGSFASKDVVARLAGGNERANLSLAYQWRATQGFNVAPVGDEQDGSRLRTFSLRAGARLQENMSLDISLRNSEKHADRDGFGNFSAPAGSLAQAFDDASTLSNSVFLAGANLKWDTFNGSLSHQFKANHNGTTTTDADRTFLSNRKKTTQAASLRHPRTMPPN